MTHRLLAGRMPASDVVADIIILALDRVDDTIAAIRSAQSQMGVPVHVHVLDQGSTPDNLARLSASIDGCCSLWVSDGNLGVAGGRNLLSSLGQARVIVALDNDAVFASGDIVARLVSALDAEPALAVVGCRIVAYGTGLDDLTSWGYPRALLTASGEAFDAVTYVGAGHAIRRSAWEDVGGYDSALFFCWEEFDFALRAIALGWRIRYRGDIVIHHKVAAEQRVTWSSRRWFYFVRNRLYLSRKYGLTAWPRLFGYLVKGLLNGMPVTTVRAILATRQMNAAYTGDRLGERAADYLRRNDQLHRGSLLKRLRLEVFAMLGSTAAASAGR
jgi:GT2 family glycosyltransferase